MRLAAVARRNVVAAGDDGVGVGWVAVYPCETEVDLGAGS